MELEGKKVVVVGLAASGVSAVKFLANKGAEIIATDVKPASELAASREQISHLEVELMLGGHPDRAFERADMIVVSPGVPKFLPALVAAQERGVPVLSELELAARHLEAPMIAVTGTNGKSTTVALIGEILKSALGEDQVFVGGNIGTPITEALMREAPVKAAVVEVSSFQLEFAKTFAPRVAVMLNLTPDHLDRYRDFQEYVETKQRIFENQKEEDFAVINIDDPAAKAMVPSLVSKLITVSLNQEPTHGMWLKGEALEYRSPEGEREELLVGEVSLHGRHNLLNVMASASAALAFGCSMDAVRRAVRGFSGLSHRLELVRELGGVRFFNDSKATNSGAVEAAVTGLSGPIILLMGGQAKGCTFEEMALRVRDRVKQVVAFGESRGRLKSDMNGKIPVSAVETMDQALAEAMSMAAPGDAILLAPGCASFDQFRDYQERGEIFRKLVMEMT